MHWMAAIWWISHSSIIFCHSGHCFSLPKWLIFHHILCPFIVRFLLQLSSIFEENKIQYKSMGWRIIKSWKWCASSLQKPNVWGCWDVVHCCCCRKRWFKCERDITLGKLGGSCNGEVHKRASFFGGSPTKSTYTEGKMFARNRNIKIPPKTFVHGRENDWDKTQEVEPHIISTSLLLCIFYGNRT